MYIYIYILQYNIYILQYNIYIYYNNIYISYIIYIYIYALRYAFVGHVALQVLNSILAVVRLSWERQVHLGSRPGRFEGCLTWPCGQTQTFSKAILKISKMKILT